MMNGSHDARCAVCKTVGLIMMIFAVLFTIAAFYGAWRVFFVLENRIGTTDASLAIIAALFAMGAVKKGMKMCPCRSKGGCGCGCGGSCGCGGGCACGKDNCDCGKKHDDVVVGMPK